MPRCASNALICTALHRGRGEKRDRTDLGSRRLKIAREKEEERKKKRVPTGDTMTVVNRTIETITITILIILLIIIIIPINFLFFVLFVLLPFSIQVHKYLHTIKYNDRYEGAVERVSHFSLFFASFVSRVFPETNDSSLFLSLSPFRLHFHSPRSTHTLTYTHTHTHTHTLFLSLSVDRL